MTSSSSSIAFAARTSLSLWDLARRAAAVFAEQAAESTGPQYVFISTRDIVTALVDAGFEPTLAVRSRSRDGNARYARHMLRFQPVLQSLSLADVLGADLARLLQTSKDLLAPTFQTLVEATKEPFVQAILDLQVERMVFGRAILLGDAAFVPRPHTAGSTAKAAADALALAKALHPAGSDIDEALSDWQAWQLREGVGMTEWGMDVGDRIMGIPRSEVMLKAA